MENCGELHWNFEDRDGDGRGDLRGWDGSGDYLRAPDGSPLQPTYGDNVSLRRQLSLLRASDPSPLRGIRPVADLGGDYWDVGWPIGHEGNFWVGTSEARPTAALPSDTVVGDAAAGDLASPAFLLDKAFVKFLASGTCGADVHVRLEERVTRRVVLSDCTAQAQAADAAANAVRVGCPGVRCAAALETSRRAQNALTQCMEHRTTSSQEVAAPSWEPVQVVTGYRNNDPHQPITVSYDYTPAGACNEAMTRVEWSTVPITRRGNTATYRLRIVDAAANGHVNADDFWITDRATLPAPPPPPLWGFADLHTHPAAHMAFGGLLFAGTAAGAVPGGSDRPGGTLGVPRPPTDFWADLDMGCRAFLPGAPVSPLGHWPCHNTHGYDLDCNRAAAGEVLGRYTSGARTSDGRQRPYGQFARAGLSAPSWYNASHQMMHVNWIRRAYEGGLRLMVADAVNNRAVTWLMQANPGNSPPNDSDAIERQFRYVRDLVAANASWMEIALSPPHARRIIGAGKLAVVLGTEVDAFGECAFTSSAIREAGSNVPITERCEWTRVLASLDRFEAMGQRKMIPVHFADNGFGGMAVYSPIFNAAANWSNRGDLGNPCLHPWSSELSCAWLPRYRDLEASYPGDLFDECWRTRTLDICRAVLGWTLLRDATPQLGPLGFKLPAEAQYLTISHNPVPNHNVRGCIGIGYCASVADFNIRLPGYVDGLPDANVLGLTETGRALVPELMRRGFLIDVQHMSERAVNEVLGLVDPGLGFIPGHAGAAGHALLAGDDAACNALDVDDLEGNASCRSRFYPVMSSHTDVRYMDGDLDPDGRRLTTETLPAGQNENLRSLDQIRRIYQTGGLMGLGTVAGTTNYLRSYRRLRDLVGGAGIAVGSDANGGDAGAPPRLLGWSCFDGPLPDAAQPLVRYRSGPGRPEPAYLARPCSVGAKARTLRRSNDEPPLRPLTLPSQPGLPVDLRNPAPFDINTDGFANVGMYPDYFQDLRAIGASRDQMRSLFLSTERFVQMWEKSCRLAQAADPSASNASCRCDPGTLEGRGFCPAGSPGLR